MNRVVPKETGVLWILNKLTKGMLILLALAVIVALFVPLFRQSQRLTEEKFSLDQQIKQLETENRKLEAEAAALSRDPKAVERVAREKMGLAKPDERIYKFEQPKQGEILKSEIRNPK
jgi:cell division protein FtsL